MCLLIYESTIHQMTTLSVTSGRTKEWVSQSVELELSNAAQHQLDSLFVKAFQTGALFPSPGREKVVCVVNSNQSHTGEIKGESQVAVVRLSVQTDRLPKMNIVFRDLPTDEMTEEWLTTVGTPQEPRKQTMMPHDHHILASMPAGMAASYFGGYEIDVPAPGIWFSREGEDWKCDKIVDVPVKDTEEAINTASLLFAQNKPVVRIYSPNSPEENLPIVVL